MLDFLAYLEFERGLSRNTLDAYRSDLQQFGAPPRAGPGGDALDVDPGRPRGVRRLAGRRATATARRSRPRRCSARSPACAPSTATCGARSCSREDPTAQLRAPRQDRKLPQVLSRDEVAPPARAARRRRARRAARPRAAGDHVRLRPARLRGDRRSRSATSTSRPGILRARGKGSKERLVPDRLDRRPRARGLPAARPPQARRRPPRAAPVPQPPRRRADPPGALQDRPAPRALGRAWPRR